MLVDEQRATSLTALQFINPATGQQEKRQPHLSATSIEEIALRCPRMRRPAAGQAQMQACAFGSTSSRLTWVALPAAASTWDTAQGAIQGRSTDRFLKHRRERRPRPAFTLMQLVETYEPT
jgi:hypothetical protein